MVTHLKYTLNFLYITFTIFYYNTISLKRTFFPVLVKGLYQTESYRCNVVFSIFKPHNDISVFTRCGVGSLAICCLSRIFYFFLDRQSEARKQYDELSVNHANSGGLKGGGGGGGALGA